MPVQSVVVESSRRGVRSTSLWSAVVCPGRPVLRMADGEFSASVRSYRHGVFVPGLGTRDWRTKENGPATMTPRRGLFSARHSDRVGVIITCDRFKRPAGAILGAEAGVFPHRG